MEDDKQGVTPPEESTNEDSQEQIESPISPTHPKELLGHMRKESFIVNSIIDLRESCGDVSENTDSDDE